MSVWETDQCSEQANPRARFSKSKIIDITGNMLKISKKEYKKTIDQCPV